MTIFNERYIQYQVKLSIIIVSFNTREVLRECLCSVYSAEIGYPFEIIVVDNNSYDGSAQMVQKYFPLAKVIENKENLLFAKANNQAAVVAKGEYLLLLNSDTLTEKGNLDILINFLDRSDNRIACVGPVLLNKDNTHQSSGYALPSICERFAMVFKLYRWLPKSVARLILPIGIPGLYTVSHRVGWIGGSCILIRKSVYRLVGGLNEMLEFYGEEPELGWKLKKRGYETWIVSNSSIIHLGGCSSKNESANFLNNIDGKLLRYARLQKYTVGYPKAIRMSQVVIIAAFIKQILANDQEKRSYFKNAIKYERKVIDYLRNALHNQKDD